MPLSLQAWRHITFVHWRYEPRALRPFVPAGLELQTFDGAAWVGLTPFELADLRVTGLPPVPGWSTFAEVNLRTYVRRGRHDGLLFLRVHCARRLVTAGFRAGLGLPYAYRPGAVTVTGTKTAYELAGTRAVVDVGARVDPDPLLTVLTGRWNAFTSHAGALWRVPVEHPPWPLRAARLRELRTDLPARLGLPRPDHEPLVHYAESTDVRIGAPRRAR